MKLFDCTLRTEKSAFRMILDLAPNAIAKRDGRIDPVPSRSVLLSIVKIFSLLILVIALASSSALFCRGATIGHSGLAEAHVGEGEGQIAQVVLQRARALYLQKVREGAVRNPCYFAMDATRPNDLSDGKLGQRFYVICESTDRFVRFRRVTAAAAI